MGGSELKSQGALVMAAGQVMTREGASPLKRRGIPLAFASVSVERLGTLSRLSP